MLLAVRGVSVRVQDLTPLVDNHGQATAPTQPLETDCAHGWERSLSKGARPDSSCDNHGQATAPTQLVEAGCALSLECSLGRFLYVDLPPSLNYGADPDSISCLPWPSHTPTNRNQSLIWLSKNYPVYAKESCGYFEIVSTKVGFTRVRICKTPVK